MAAFNNLAMNEWIHLFLYIYLQKAYDMPQKDEHYETIELWWYASFLRYMHLAIFISNLIQNILAMYAKAKANFEKVGSTIEDVIEEVTDLKSKKPAGLYEEYYEATSTVKCASLLHDVLSTTTSAFYVMAIMFISDRSLRQFDESIISADMWTFEYLSFFYLVSCEILLFMAGFFTIPYALAVQFIKAKFFYAIGKENVNPLIDEGNKRGIDDSLKIREREIRMLQTYFIPIFIGSYILYRPEFHNN